jgi:hypothetical protein
MKGAQQYKSLLTFEVNICEMDTDPTVSLKIIKI